MADPRFSFGNMSPIEDSPSVTGVDPAQPAKNRSTISILREELTAQAIVNMRNVAHEIMYTHRRPYISDVGAITRGPTANPRTYMDTTISLRITLEEPNSLITSGTAGANMDEASGL
jgi:hypothetical protein